MLNHLIRGLLFHYKKVLFCFNFIWKGCFKKMHHLFFRVRANDVNSTKSQPKIFICWINKMTSDKRWQAKFSGIVLRWKQFLSFKNCRSVSICSVLNRSNRDTTVYYRLIFCAFSWPNMVKWRNSGIINDSIDHKFTIVYLFIFQRMFSHYAIIALRPWPCLSVTQTIMLLEVKHLDFPFCTWY